MEHERSEQQPVDKKIWVTPKVIVSDQPVRDTKNLAGGGLDGGAFPNTSS